MTFHFHRNQGASLNAPEPIATALSRRSGGGVVGDSLRDGGSGARSSVRVGGRTASLRLIGLTAILATAFLALTASPALAARGHVESSQVIGKPCTKPVCGEEELKQPSAVAVNEATNQVYVLDQGNARVLIFNAETGAQVGEFDGSGELGEGTKAGFGGNPGEIETGQFSYLKESSAPLEPQNGAIAVDNSCVLHEPPLTELTTPTCEEFDPSNGDVYVADPGFGHRVIDKFSASGEYLGQITEREGVGFQDRPLAGVAVDSTGEVWVYLGDAPRVYGFSNGAPNLFDHQTLLQTGPNAGFAAPGIAVDSEGNFYPRLLIFGPGAVDKNDPAGKLLIEAIDGEESTAVAVEQTTGAVFIADATSVGAFSPTGDELERFGFEEELVGGAGIGVDAASGFAYVADAAAGHLLVLAPQLPGPPLVETQNQFVSAVTSADATLHTEINPRSEAGEDATTYSFQYLTQAEFEANGDSFSGPNSPVATPLDQIPPDFEVHPVEALISGLQPGTTYHYRAVAENSHDPGSPVEGEEGIFTTQPAAAFALPDSRQWQLVSPAEKLGAKIQPISESGVVQAAAGGAAITYLTSSPTEAQPQGNSNETQVLSSRSSTSWSSRDISIPHLDTTGKAIGDGPESKFFNRELSLSAVQPFGEFNPALSAEASESTAYLHDLSPSCGASCFHPLVTGKSGFANVPEGTHFGEEALCQAKPGKLAVVVCGPKVIGATDDLSHLVLQAGAALTEGAGDNQLYEWVGGALSQVSLLPSGEPAPELPAPSIGLKQGGNSQAARRAISSDGSRIVWESEPNLYLRDMALGKTVQLDQAEAVCGECESGAGHFQIASADGSRVFFTDTHKLTLDSGAEGAGAADLYECTIAIEAGKLRCALTDLTPANGGEGARVQGGVLGASEDGSYLYFIAKGILASNHVDNGTGEEGAQAGEPNLYLRHNGVTSFLATLSEGDNHDWEEELLSQPTRVSPNGNWLELMSERSLTGFDNRDAATGQPVAEVYLYDAAAGRLRCASCDPSGGRPDGVEYHKLEPGSGGLTGGGRDIWTDSLVAANVPGWTAIGSGGQLKSRYQDRYLSDSGRLFFNANDGLVPADSNGTEDVYQYEPPGVGSCTASSPTFSAGSGGCVDLISSGSSGEESAFLDASESGDDVFFLTYSKLVGQDTDNQLDVYDAHVCTAASPCLPELSAAPEPCKGEGCQAAAAPPAESTPGTSGFGGAGNVATCPKGKVKQKGKCVTKHKPKKHKKHHKKKSHKKHNKSKRTAGHKHGGGK